MNFGKRVFAILWNLLKRSGIFLGFVVLCLLVALLDWQRNPQNPTFLTLSNFHNIFRQAAVIAILAAGMTFVILTAGIDLSVGSLLAFSSAAMAKFMPTIGLPYAILLGIAVGSGLGLVNGFFIAKGGVAPFVVTLGMMTIARSLTLVCTGGEPISRFPKEFLWIGTGDIGYIAVSIILTITVYLGLHIILNYTRFGRCTYSIGGNEEAAKLSGINVVSHKIKVYTLNGCLSALAGIVLTSRLASAHPQAGLGYELDAIAAVVIGGTSLSGGEGGLFGTLIGALIMQVLRNGMNILNVSIYWQQAVVGSLIIAAVVLDRVRRRM